jgi:hypothetical protein
MATGAIYRMAEKRTFECNTFACKTFACGSFANNQQQSQFCQGVLSIQPGTFTTIENTVYPEDFNNVYTNIWQPVVNEGVGELLLGRLMTSGNNELLSERLMNEPDSSDEVLTDLLIMGMRTGTQVTFGMGISGVTTNTTQPKAFNARLMKEPT